LSNICNAQQTIDELPIEVEKNVLYDVGGELQRILEETYIYNAHKDYGKRLQKKFDKMLNVIIDRVKEIETQRIHYNC
jgi:hypothetical protein